MSGKKFAPIVLGLFTCGLLAMSSHVYAAKNGNGMNGNGNGNGKMSKNGMNGNENGMYDDDMDEMNGMNGNGNGMRKMKHGAVPRCFGPRAKLYKPYRYNPASSTMTKGVVMSLDSVSYPDGPMVHLKMDTPEGPMMVVLGPAYYYNRANIALQPGDQVQVAGSSVWANGEEVIIATEVKKNGRTLQLRDSHGRPFWNQQGRK